MDRKINRMGSFIPREHEGLQDIRPFFATIGNDSQSEQAIFYNVHISAPDTGIARGGAFDQIPPDYEAIAHFILSGGQQLIVHDDLYSIRSGKKDSETIGILPFRIL